MRRVNEYHIILCFCGEIRKIAVFFEWTIHIVWSFKFCFQKHVQVVNSWWIMVVLNVRLDSIVMSQNQDSANPVLEIKSLHQLELSPEMIVQLVSHDFQQFNSFIPEFLKWTFPFLNLDLTTDANRGFSLKLNTEWQKVWICTDCKVVCFGLLGWKG